MAWNRRKLQANLGTFMRQYGRGHARHDPNDHVYDRRIEEMIKRIPVTDGHRCAAMLVVVTRDPKTIPPWSSPFDAIRFIARGLTFRTASKVAVVVGTLLTAVNQGSVIAAGNIGAVTWMRVGFNYAIPYAVASIGYLAPFRRR